MFKKIFKIERKPKKGLLALEWMIIGYALLTLLIILFTYTKLANPETMIWGRVRFFAITAAMWIVYRLVPCRFTMLARVTVQMLLLGWWYPDTYELNRILPNLDYLFAGWEQQLFGSQPALWLSQVYSSRIISELMAFGYAAYFPMVVVVVLYYFLYRYEEYQRASFIILGAFFLYYVIFIFLPVTGPQYYYPAVGLENIANGVFPQLGDYFNTHQYRMDTPGWKDGFFYQQVVSMHDAGERPTAAFPSSHVGITTVLMMLVAHARAKRLFWILFPVYMLLCLSTVYIMAHYVIDALAGLVTGVIIYVVLLLLSKRV